MNRVALARGNVTAALIRARRDLTLLDLAVAGWRGKWYGHGEGRRTVRPVGARLKESE